MTGTSIARAELLQCLESTWPGVSPSVTVEQADCFVFRKGWLYTFDGEIRCKTKTPLPAEIRGAVHGKPLIDALRSCQADNIAVSTDADWFIVKAKKDTIKVRRDKNILLPYDRVDRPENWARLPSIFSEAMEMVVECAGKDTQRFLITCVHLTPKWIEATDMFSFARYRMQTGLEASSLIRAEHAKSLASRGPTKIGVTENWMHFRNDAGLTISVVRFDPADHKGEKLERLSIIAKERGESVPFPKSLVPAAKLAEIFTGEYKDNNVVKVFLKDGLIRVVGEGISGKVEHENKIKYHGTPFAFTVGPNTLAGIVKNYNDIEIADNRLLVAGGKWHFSTWTKPITKEKRNADPDRTEGEDDAEVSEPT